MSIISDIAAEVQNSALREVDNLDKQLQYHFQTKFLVQPALTRFLVSFQANKTRPIYRWYKYKEAFSASLVELLLQKYGLNQGKILDPFAGSGTALFAASDWGLDAFADAGHSPLTFFVGAAIERRMASEIWEQLESGALSNAANLNEENQVASISRWLCSL